MTTHQELKPVEFVAVLFRPKGRRREEFHFLPRCSGCGKIIFDVAEANFCVVEGSLRRLKRTGYEGTEVTNRAALFCWECDREHSHVPWLNALAVLRALDEPQRHPEPVQMGISLWAPVPGRRWRVDWPRTNRGTSQ
jgi:hypothetical protein